ncbi:MAG: hypothetical protein DMG61_23165 [Acidobacteria bacterium]|nr:MAG: hypothetical protein DMG61_23165 [Acidobacteriota bacterium]
MTAYSGPGAGRPDLRGNTGSGHSSDWNDVAHRYQNDGHDHCQRVHALRILDLTSYIGGVIEAHVVPHAHQQPGNESEGLSRSRRGSSTALPMQERKDRKDDEWSKHDEQHYQ